MTATSLPVKMAACLPQDGDTTDEEKITRCPTSHTHKHPIGGTQGEDKALSATSIDIKYEGDKAYDEVAKYDEEDLRNLLEEVTNVGRNKASISPYALLLIRKEQDALREESSSDDGELALRQRNKKLIGRRDQSATSDQSAAARASTGGSLGSLHDSAEPKPKEGHNQGVASRSREGGSCGNLSRGSFETQPPRKRKWRRSRDAARASTSQREGGSLQNLSKAGGTSNHPKNLHKSGSLSQVCSEVTGARNKNRRQKTSSESSSSRYRRHSEDREGGGESSGDENPNHCLLPSPHSTLSTHSAEHSFPPEGVGGASGLGTDWNNDLDDSQSEDATEGETTDDENENKEYSRGLGSLGRNCSNEPIEEDGIELQEVTVHKGSTDVDRSINFNLNRSQEDNMHGSCGRRTLPLQDSQCVNSIFKEEKSKGSDHDEVLGKRKLLTSRSDTANSENKSSLDENGNPIMGTSSSSSLLTSSNSDRQFGSTHPVPRRNGLSAPHKEISRFDRLKAKSDKKKANKEKGVVNIKETPGFCGDQDIHELLKFLGAENETSTKNRKKHKNREDEKVKKRTKNNDKLEDEKIKSDDLNSKINEDVSISGNESNRKSKEREEERKTTNNKKNKSESGKSKKKGGNLRESSSVEDLVSKSKQSDNVRDIRKQVTVDDGDMGLGVLHTYHTSKKVDQLNNFIVDGKYLKETDPVDVQNDNESGINPTSEFVADFYSVGDSFLTADLSQAPSSPSGDFEIVSSKKRNKKYRSGSQTASQSSKSGGSDRWSAGSNSGSVYSEDNFRGHRFCPNKLSGRCNAGFEKPQINFTEGPRTVHENTFLARWSQYGVGERHGGDRYGATTSAPHSEDSESDGDDSVHSMPAPSITPRPDVRKPPPSSGSTPQASYANIAKLAASANHAQMKRMSANSGSQSATGLMKELEKDLSNDTEQPDSKSALSESRPNILDDNFPSLNESLGASSPPSAIFTSKVSELRTNPACESAVIPPKVSNVQLQTVDKPNDINMSGVCDGKSGSQENIELIPAAVTSQEGPAKSPVVCPSSTSPPPPHSSHQYPQHQVRYQSYQSHQPSPPPQHTQSFQPRSHHNHKHSQHQNTQYSSSHNTPPLYYQYQRYNPFNRKDDDPPPNALRFAPPVRAPNSNHLNVVPPYPPPIQPSPHFKQPQFSQPPPPPPPHVQQNPQSQQNPHIQRNPQPTHTTQLQIQNFQEKPPPQPHNLSTQQYPPLQSPYSQNSQVPKPPHMQSNTHIQRPPQPHSQSNLNPQQSPNPLQSSPPVKNTIQQQNHLSQPNVHFNSHGQPNQHVEQTYSNKVHSPLEKPPPQATPTQRPIPNSEQSTAQPQNHKLSARALDTPSELVKPDQRCSPPVPTSIPPPSIAESSPVLHPPSSVVEALKVDAVVHHANNLPVRESSEDRHLLENKSHKSSDPSRLKKLEPAVVFTDNAKFDHNVSGLEFGFGFDDPIVTSDGVSESDSLSIDIKNSNNVTKDFSKWFQAPKNDVINCNYEELTRHLSNEWDKTVQLMEGDPKNVQYWRASSSMEA
ncbi:dentin sialophosphoprotein-like isoform X2 [Palaemon carinicauda]|uniref:dentin sialophosphoprotein-like isoform X2 n=1 Tax=Palaemon carinicauda TaxID=392227 RepID=UPI0035B58853